MAAVVPSLHERRRRVAPRACRTCGGAMPPGSRRPRLTCSQRCRRSPDARRCGRCRVSLAGLGLSGGARYCRPCAPDRHPFAGDDRITCSPECQTRRRRKIPAAWRKAVVDAHGIDCYLCGGPIELDAAPAEPLSLSFDHVVPLSRGGRHAITNLRPAHRRCNVAKGTANEKDFRLRIVATRASRRGAVICPRASARWHPSPLPMAPTSPLHSLTRDRAIEARRAV
jgi:hypothetical protein